MEALTSFIQSLNPTLAVVLLALVVFLVVKILSLLGFLKDGTYKRIGVLIGSFLSSTLIAEGQQAITSVLIGLLSVAFNEFSVWVGKKVSGSE